MMNNYDVSVERSPSTRRTLNVALLVVAALTLAAFSSAFAFEGRNDDGHDEAGNYGNPEDANNAYAIGLWGDLPYSAAQAAALPFLIADMNSQNLAFTVNDGDLKAGSNSPCNDALYTCDTAPDSDEFRARNAANIAWMQETFAVAIAKKSVAVMIIGQADPGFDKSDATRAPLRDPMTLAETDGQPDGYQSFLTALREQITLFRKPVAFVHGDSHYFRVDRPLLDLLGRRLENFTRVETFGDNQANGTNDVNWLKVLVDPKSREVFAYQAQIVPANRVAVPAP